MAAHEDLERIAEGYRAFVAEAAAESPVYSALAAAVAEDADVLAYLAGPPRGKRQPNVLFAALRFLGGVPQDAASLRRRVLGDADRLRVTMARRATQTNEPARCAALLLLPALAMVGGPSRCSRWAPPRGCASVPTATAASTTDVRSATGDRCTCGARRPARCRCRTACRTSSPASAST